MSEFVIKKDGMYITVVPDTRDPIMTSQRYVWSTAREAKAQLELWCSQSPKREKYLEGFKVYEVQYLEVVS